MLTELVELLDDYWRSITRIEDFIRQYGHTADPLWESRPSPDLPATYETVRPFLEPVSGRQLFHNLPGGLNAFAGENAHHALVMILNHPERWFGNIGVLQSPEYVALKRKAEEEERGLAAAYSSKSAMASPGDTLPDLNDTEVNILEAMDDEPRRWSEIAERAGYEPHTVRKYSTKFQDMGLIRPTKRGFVRTVRLPGDEDEKEASDRRQM